jgi:peptide/nickel transport system substrate-binding protein
MSRRTRIRLIRTLVVLALPALWVAAAVSAAAAAPAGQMTWAVHITLAPRWLDPGDNEGAITPFLTLDAVHDALLKPMPATPRPTKTCA